LGGCVKATDIQVKGLRSVAFFVCLILQCKNEFRFWNDNVSQVTQHLAEFFGISKSESAIQSLASTVSVMSLAAGSRLFASGDVCENFVIIASGRARVQLSTKTGRDITLFRLDPGQSCALTTSCLLSQSPYYAEGVAETDLEVISIPSSAFREAMQAYPQMMGFLLSDYAVRIADLTTLIDRLTSRDLNLELSELLLAQASSSGEVLMSHKAIAEELGTAREVVSRKLKDWERQKWVKLKRGKLSIQDVDAISRLAR